MEPQSDVVRESPARAQRHRLLRGLAGRQRWA